MRHVSRFAIIAAVLASVVGLQGCLPLVATGMVVGAKAMMDRRTVSAQTEDAEIQVRAINRIASVVKDHGGVSIHSYNRRVLLTGQVPDAASKRNVEQAVLPIPGVKAVYNELQVAPRATLAVESRDAALTTRIKASFLEQKGLNVNTVKVVTEGGVVYLLGLVTEREGKVYSGVASRISGVQRVVTLFEYISEETLNRL